MMAAARLGSALVLSVVASAAMAQGVVYTPIPPGFDFPAAEATLTAAINANDQRKLRLHGWMVYAGLTQPARPADPTSEALWETWYPGEEVFSPSALPQAARVLQRR